MTRPVLVTGGAGYIASHVVLALLDAGRPVLVVDDLSTGFRQAVPSAARFERADVGDTATLVALLKEEGVDEVLHFAGSVSAPESMRDPDKYFDNNTGRSRALIAACVRAGVSRLVFSSTAAVYGAVETGRVAEDAPKRPINPYGASKLMTEEMLAWTAAAHGLRYAALRYFNVAGADPGGRAGQATRGCESLVKVAVDAACGRRGPVAVFGDDYPTPDGTGVRDYIHVSDLADAHLQALAALERSPDPLVLNCGYGQGRSVLEVLEAVERAAGRPVPRVKAPRRAGDPAEVVADTRRILERTDWRPRRAALDLIVADAWRWGSHPRYG